jgi:hypothetical protein
MGIVGNAVRGALGAVSLEELASPDALTLSLSKGERSHFDKLNVSAVEVSR